MNETVHDGARNMGESRSVLVLDAEMISLKDPDSELGADEGSPTEMPWLKSNGPATDQQMNGLGVEIRGRLILRESQHAAEFYDLGLFDR